MRVSYIEFRLKGTLSLKKSMSDKVAIELLLEMILNNANCQALIHVPHMCTETLFVCGNQQIEEIFIT